MLGELLNTLPLDIQVATIIFHSYVFNLLSKGIALAALIQQDTTIFRPFTNHPTNKLPVHSFYSILHQHDYNPKTQKNNFSDHILQLKLYY